MMDESNQEYIIITIRGKQIKIKNETWKESPGIQTLRSIFQQTKEMKDRDRSRE